MASILKEIRFFGNGPLANDVLNLSNTFQQVYHVQQKWDKKRDAITEA